MENFVKKYFAFLLPCILLSSIAFAGFEFEDRTCKVNLVKLDLEEEVAKSELEEKLVKGLVSQGFVIILDDDKEQEEAPGLYLSNEGQVFNLYRIVKFKSGKKETRILNAFKVSDDLESLPKCTKKPKKAKASE